MREVGRVDLRNDLLPAVNRLDASLIRVRLAANDGKRLRNLFRAAAHDLLEDRIHQRAIDARDGIGGDGDAILRPQPVRVVVRLQKEVLPRQSLGDGPAERGLRGLSVGSRDDFRCRAVAARDRRHAVGCARRFRDGCHTREPRGGAVAGAGGLGGAHAGRDAARCAVGRAGRLCGRPAAARNGILRLGGACCLGDIPAVGQRGGLSIRCCGRFGCGAGHRCAGRLTVGRGGCLGNLSPEESRGALGVAGRRCLARERGEQSKGALGVARRDRFCDGPGALDEGCRGLRGAGRLGCARCEQERPGLSVGRGGCLGRGCVEERRRRLSVGRRDHFCDGPRRDVDRHQRVEQRDGFGDRRGSRAAGIGQDFRERDFGEGVMTEHRLSPLPRDVTSAF